MYGKSHCKKRKSNDEKILCLKRRKTGFAVFPSLVIVHTYIIMILDILRITDISLTSAVAFGIGTTMRYATYAKN